MRGMFASRKGSLSAPVIKQGKFLLSFYSIRINVCMHRNWCEGIVAEIHSVHSTLARVRAFISANDSFRYRQLQQQSVRKVCEVSSLTERTVYS
jgi:hypothetical protein